jgi:GPH family glycoside/pentoside/hexuronide:cation symporter
MYLGAFLVGLGGANATLLFPLIGDIVDYGEIKIGKALTGLTNSGYSIGCKVGSGLGGAMVGWILTFAGYDGMAAVQSAGAISGIRFLFGAIPFITSVLAAVLCWITNVEGELKKARA